MPIGVCPVNCQSSSNGFDKPAVLGSLPGRTDPETNVFKRVHAYSGLMLVVHVVVPQVFELEKQAMIQVGNFKVHVIFGWSMC